jgi:hypothetical protein
MQQPIYVEIRIRGEMDDLWRLTQTPDLHERWDLRFTDIKYLPRTEGQPQRFLYATRIGFGLNIRGEGESVGSHDGPHGRASALKFWSNDPKSLIREGSGYWKYVPSPDGIRFLTGYDYRTRFGWFGRWFDQLIFRPLIGWATAWSFDRLRLWIECGIDPAVSMQRSIIHALARVTIAAVWIYQGLVPKLLFSEQSGEIATVRSLGLFTGRERELLLAVGLGEVAFGVFLLVFWRRRSLLAINAAAMIVLAIAAAASDARLYLHQFNPATLNLALIALSLIGWIAGRDVPGAHHCLRHEAGRS